MRAGRRMVRVAGGAPSPEDNDVGDVERDVERDVARDVERDDVSAGRGSDSHLKYLQYVPVLSRW